jgi:lactate dehydrogenase-like 2-hydroxyacid dehydrogenase
MERKRPKVQQLKWFYVCPRISHKRKMIGCNLSLTRKEARAVARHRVGPRGTFRSRTCEKKRRFSLYFFSILSTLHCYLVTRVAFFSIPKAFLVSYPLNSIMSQPTTSWKIFTPTMETASIGIIGMGDMGKMYARRLSAAGWR